MKFCSARAAIINSAGFLLRLASDHQGYVLSFSSVLTRTIKGAIGVIYLLSRGGGGSAISAGQGSRGGGGACAARWARELTTRLIAAVRAMPGGLYGLDLCSYRASFERKRHISVLISPLSGTDSALS